MLTSEQKTIQSRYTKEKENNALRWDNLACIRHLSGDFKRLNSESYKVHKSLRESVSAVCNNDTYLEYTFYLTVLALLLYKYSGQKQIYLKTCLPPSRDNSSFQALVLFIELQGAINFKEAFGLMKAEITKSIGSESHLSDDLMAQDKHAGFFLSDSYEAPVTGGFSIVLQKNNIKILFDSGKFETKLVGNFLRNYTCLLKNTLDTPYRPIGELSFIHPEELSYLTTVIGRADEDYKGNSSILKELAAICSDQPKAIAISEGSIKLTYGDLWEQSNRLAAYLSKQKKVRKGDRVGIYMDRSSEMLTVILGIMKTGALFVPLDPLYPIGRIENLLNSSRPTAVVSISHYMSHLQDLYQGEICIMDLEEFEIASFKGQSLEMHIEDGDGCYLLFTSGSTGLPKGIEVSHSNLSNYVYWANQYYFQGKSGYPFAFFTSPSFDLTFTSIFTTFLRADTIEVYSSNEVHKVLTKIFEQDIVNTVKITPSHIELLKELHQGATAIRKVIVGGEVLHSDQVTYLQSLHPDLKVYNEYGPTEVTIGCTLKKITGAEQITIGRPIAKHRAYVVNQNGRLQPEGVAGELAIAGPGVAKGYFKEAALTESKFKPLLSDCIKETRVYHTGDMVRWLPEGELAYLGRKDRQIKIRGYRVELEEIEEAIREQHWADKAIVVFRDNRLIAYYSKSGSAALDKDALILRLPSYMLPDVLVEIDKIPLTVNGKVDYDRLPDPETIQRDRTIIAPASSEEEMLLTIWKEVLGKESISTKDNFFSLGGDSIKGITLISRINKVAGTSLDVKDIFNHQTIVDLSDYLILDQKTENIVIYTEEYFEQFRQKIWDSNDNRNESLDPVEDTYPLSDIEAGMLFHSSIQKESATYHDQFFYSFKDKDYTPGLIVKAFELLTQKHDILRAKYNFDNHETPHKLILKNLDIDKKLIFRDISTENISSKKKIIEEDMLQDRKKGFADEIGLWRAVIYNLSNGEVGFLFNFHHAIIDGWSRASLVIELNEVYQALKSNSNFTPKPLKSTYKDYIADQWIVSDSEDIRDYWLKMLAGYTYSGLPFKKGIYPSKKVTRRASFDLDKETRDLLLTYTKNTGISLKNICFAAFIHLVKLTTATEDMVVGLVTNGRPAIEDGEKIIGCFLNTVPFRLLPQQPDVRRNDFLEFVNEQLIQLKSFDKLSLIKIQQLINMNRDQPVFDVLFSYVDFFINEQAEKVTLTDNGVEYFESTDTNFDFGFGSSSGRMGYSIAYNPEIFSTEEIALFAKYYHIILTQMMKQPQKALSKISLLQTPAQGLAERAIEDYISPTTILEGLRQLGPDAGMKTAIFHEEKTVSYKDLVEKSDTFAAYIIHQYDIKKGDKIALFMNPSSTWVISMLSILKTGAVFVPIDTKYPEERIQAILNESGALLSISYSDHMAELMEIYKGNICMFDIQEYEIDNFKGKQGVREVSPEDGCYLLYTSGSTGVPKGIEVSHGSLANYSAWANQYYFQNKTGYRFAFFTSPSFDLTFTSIFTTLLRGDTIEVNNKEDMAVSLQEIFKSKDINSVKLTPSHVEILKEVFSGKSSIRKVILGGETLHPHQVNYLMTLNSEMEIYNEYGPTEATIGCTIKKVTHSRDISIGKPIGGHHIYIVDEDDTLQPVGLSGELLIAGPGLAKGYHNDDALTTKKFMPPNNSMIPEQRVYRSGDLARWKPNGDLDLIGRIDRQVKIRGHRVELTEIDQLINEIDGVQQAIVVLESNILTAYYRALSELPIDRQILKNRLPDHMIPVNFVWIDEVPLTSNGKINYSSLSSINKNEENREIIPPSTPEEKMLLSIWKDVLSKENISMDDNFFSLGGDSISAIQICARVQNKGYSLEVNDIFNKLKISSIAVDLGELDYIADQGTITGFIPFTPIQLRFFSLYTYNPHKFHQSFLLRLKKKVDIESLEKVFTKIITHHDALRVQLEKKEESDLPRLINSTVPSKIPVSTLGKFSGHKDKALKKAIDDLYNSINLEETLPIAVAELFIKKEQYILLVIHHLVVDAVSWMILLEDIEQLLEEGPDSELPLKTSSYQAWAHELIEYSKTIVFEEKLLSWKKRLQYEKLNVVPDHHKELEDLVRDEKVVTTKIDKALSQKLGSHEMHQKLNTELPDLVVAAIGLTLREIFGHDKLHIALESHGREKISRKLNINRTVGWFTCIYPALIKLNNDKDLIALLKEVKDQIKQAGADSISYSVGKYLLNEPERLQDSEPTICFNYLGRYNKKESDQFDVVGMGIGETVSKEEKREYQFIFSAIVMEEQLVIQLDYNRKHFTKEKMDFLLQTLKANLGSIVEHLTAFKGSEMTPSDLTYQGLSEDELKELNALL